MAIPAFHKTPDRLIRQALRDAGRLQAGMDPSPEVYSDCLSRLADLIAIWQTQGLKLWLNQILEVPTVAGEATYTLGPAGEIIALKPYRILEGWWVDNCANRRPLSPLSWNGYYNLGNLTSIGTPVSFFVDKQYANLVVKFWPVPDVEGVIELLIQRQQETSINLSEEILFPQEWFIALRWGLADDLASGQHPLIMERCAAKAREFRQMLEDWDVEDPSTRFAISPQSTFQASRFGR